MIFQVLELKPPISFDVHRIILNDTATFIALIGEHSVAVFRINADIDTTKYD